MSDKSIPEVEASKQIYEIARREADSEMAQLRAESEVNQEANFCLGVIKANKAHRDYGLFLDAVTLYRMKKTKEYKKVGITWDAFCKTAGYERRDADRIANDITPVFESFSANLPVLSGVTLSDIRWLGKNKTDNLSGFSEDGKMLIIGEEQIPATPEDITAYIKQEKESHKKQIEEKDATLAAKDRLLKAKEELVNKMERELKRLEKSVPKSELTEEEQDAVNLLAQVQSDFIVGLSDIKKKIDPKTAPKIALRQFYYLLIFFAKIAMEERLELQTYYEGAEEVPWEIADFELPPTDVLIDNMPMTAGRGMGAKVKAKLEERQARKG